MQTITMRRKLILVIVAGALALAAALLLVLLRVAAPDPAARYAVLYAKGGGTLWLAVPEGVFPLRAERSVQHLFTENGQYLYYDGAQEDSGRDVYLLRLRDAAARREGGKPVAKGVSDWTVSADGRYLSYVEQKGRALRCYDAQRETTQALTAGVEALYAAAGQDVFFFSKLEGGQSALFRCAPGQQPERLSDAALDARLCADGAQSILFYWRDGGGSALYALAQTGAPVLIAEDVESALLDDYQLGGNLYFFKRGAGAAAAAIALDDPQAEADEVMQEPKRPGRPGGLLPGILEGIEQIIGGGTQTAYERQLAAYKEKQERDKVRAAARAALEALPAGGAALLDCYVYDGAGVQKLAGGVRANGDFAKAQMAARPFGRPALLFEKERAVTAQGAQSVSLTELLMRYRAGGEKALNEYITELAGGDIEAAGLSLAVMTAAGPNEIPMGQAAGGGAGWQAAFLSNPEEMLYMERDVEGGPFSLYSFALTEYGVSERRLAGTNAVNLLPTPAGAYYFHQESASRGALYWYQGGKSAKILANAGAFFLSAKNAGDQPILLALSDIKDEAGTLSAAEGAQVRTLASGVKIDAVRAGAAQVCYLTQWRAGAGTLCLQALGGKPAKTLDTGVTEIIDVRQ